MIKRVTLNNRAQLTKCWSVSAPRLLLPWEDAILAAGPDTKPARQWKRKDEEGLPLDALARKIVNEGREILCSTLIWQAEPLYREADERQRGPANVIVNLVQCEHGNLQATWSMLAAMHRPFEPSSPRDILSICAAEPRLYETLGANPAGIVTAEDRLLDGVWRTPCVWLGTARREVAFVPSRYQINMPCWCAFRAYYIPG